MSNAAPDPIGEDELRSIADSAPVAMWATRLDGVRIFVNRAYAAFLGVSHEEALGYDWHAIVHPDDAARLEKEIQAGSASRQPFELIGRYRNPTGEWRWLHSTLQPRLDAQGQHVGTIGIAHDITEAREAEIVLREREAQFSAFIGQSAAGIGQVDLNGRFTLVNDRFCEISGWSSSELMGMTMLDITHPDDRARNVPLFEQAVKSGKPYAYEKRYIRKDGGIVWVHNSVAVISRPDGKPLGLLAVSLDVTQRRAAEADLRKNEETLRLATESAGMATWELDPKTMQGEWSPNRFDLLGLPRAPDLRGTIDDWLNLVHPDEREIARRTLYRCCNEGKSYTIEYRMRRADSGEERWLQSHGSRIDYTDGRPSRFVGVSFDITDRRRAEEKLRDSELRFRTIFEQANDYILTTDLDQRLTSVNPAVESALGYSEAEVLGRPFFDFIDAGQFDRRAATVMRTLSSGDTARRTVHVSTRDGRRLIWEVSSRLIHDADGKATGVHAICRDVTEAKRAEAHLRLLIDELNHRVKNTLAIVQGIAQQTFKANANPVAARAAFEGRLAALSEAHNLLTREHWGPVSMTRIIDDAVAPHGGSTRFTLEGPEMNIAPKTAISLALAIHELATNAVKHGALSQSEGHVSIRWDRVGPIGSARLSMLWEEAGGPPVTVPTQRGFGTRMIERGLAAELGGIVKIEFRPAGLACIVDAPLPESTE